MSGLDKLWVDVAGSDGRDRPLLAHAIAAFQQCEAIGRVCLVVADDALERTRELADKEAFDKVSAVVPGGGRRQDSVLAGLRALGSCTWVVIHDGARPLVTADLIERGLQEAEATGASCCALPVLDTVKESDGDNTVSRTLDRSHLWLAQTPQVFRYDLLMDAHDASPDDVTDDAAVVEAMGGRVRLYAGTRRNVKVTTNEDLDLVRILLRKPQ